MKNRLHLYVIIGVLLSFSLVINCYADANARIRMANSLTSKWNAKGSPAVFEATGKDRRVLRITQKNIMQEHLLTEGQLVFLLGVYFKGGVQEKLKSAGFTRGEVIDGRNRKNPFDL